MIDVRVTKKTKETDSIYSFELSSLDGLALPAFSAGSHIDIYLGNGLIRQYSLYNDANDSRHYCIAVLNASDSRGGSRYMADVVQQGDTLRISAPRNMFPLHDGSGFYLLIAGGIGITPILSMASHLNRCGKDFVVHYCGRTAASMAFRGRLQAVPYAGRVVLHTDDGPLEQSLNPTAVIASAPEGSHLYMCGPNGFLENLISTGRRLGWTDDRLHLERFSSGGVVTSPDNKAFTLRLVRSRRELIVPPDRSAASVLNDNGVAIPLSCEQGMCGSCLTAVVEGEPDHRDTYLTDAERARNDCFTPCCSRSKGPVLSVDL